MSEPQTSSPSVSAASVPRVFVVPYSPRGSIFDVADSAAVERLLRSDATLSCGIEREAFEAEFKAYIGAEHCVSTSSCTVALEMAADLLDLSPGDEVIATPQSYQATLNPFLDLPVTVRFCDVDPNSLGLDPDALRPLLTPRTRAVVLTHYGGLPCDMAPIFALADRFGFTVIEDCAHAHGCVYDGKHVGATSHVATFSFQSMKNMSTLGQGGMLVTRSASMAERVRRLRDVEPDARFTQRATAATFGVYSAPDDQLLRHEKNAYVEDCTSLRRRGTNSVLPEAAAAVGRTQLKRLPLFVARRTAIARRLDAALGQVEGLRLQTTPDNAEHAHHLYTVFIEPESGLNNTLLSQALNERGVEIQLRYFPLHLLPEWRLRGGAYGQCPTVENVWFTQQINLPIYPSLTDEQVDYMAGAVAASVAELRKSQQRRSR